MSSLQLAWAASLLVVITALPMGAIRMVAYRSGEIDHSRTMLLAASVALSIGLVALLVLALTSVLLLT
ncbi:MAG TPA: hypothetical protein VFG88_10135 [Nocardioidaceae bacterium]|nr:hypothetical protein [Nocardioidaceae bacterium]